MRTILLAAFLAVSACAHGSTLWGGGGKRGSDAEAHYQAALEQLDPANPRGTLDSALTSLNKYLASSEPPHQREALVLRRLVTDAKQLARVEAALHSKGSGASADESKPRSEPESRPSEESVKEIQRLREELKEANAELERIRKRLAAPKP